MTKLPSKEFCDNVRAMSDEDLLRQYDTYNAQMDSLTAERQRCWDRFMEINEIQDVVGGEFQMVSIEARMNRKLKVS
jgi:hypothetical protein